MAERFTADGFPGEITIDSIGTGGGFERFCKTGETDISNASRAIKDEEAANCQAIKRTATEFRVGTDALAVVVSSENDFLTDLTIEELAKIFSNEVTQWSEVRPEWPAEDILRFSPGTDSGTFDYFIEVVMLPAYGEEKAEEAILTAENMVAWSISNAAVSTGMEVTIFLVASGVDWVRKGASGVAHLNPLDPPLRDLIGNVIAGGGRILVCPPCARVRAYEQKDLLDGVTLAGAPAMLEVVKQGAATLSF